MASSTAQRSNPSYKRAVTEPHSFSNGALIEQHLNALRARKFSTNTINRRRWLLHAVAEYIHPTTLYEATFEELLAWHTSISHLSAGSVAGYLAHIRTFYGWLVRPMRYLDVSPAADLALPSVKPTRPRPIPEDDFRRAVLGTVDDLMRTWLLLMRYAGLRCCEVAWMGRDWVVEDGDPRLVVNGKGAKQRVVFVDGELVDLLRPWMRTQGRLFLREDGRPVTPAIVSSRTSKHLHGLGLAYTAHQVRHLSATDALNRTKNIRLVQEFLGHASLESTQVYTLVDQPESVQLAHDWGADLRDLNRRKRG